MDSSANNRFIIIRTRLALGTASLQWMEGEKKRSVVKGNGGGGAFRGIDRAVPFYRPIPDI